MLATFWLLMFCTLTQTMMSQKLDKPQFCDKPHGKMPPLEEQVEKFVSDLSQEQIEVLRALSKENKQKLTVIRKEIKVVRDSIRLMMHKEGDYSKILFPLFDEEAKREANIEKELYKTRLKIDQVLTPEQKKELKGKIDMMKKAMKSHKTKSKNRQHSVKEE